MSLNANPNPTNSQVLKSRDVTEYLTIQKIIYESSMSEVSDTGTFLKKRVMKGILRRGTKSNNRMNKEM